MFVSLSGWQMLQLQQTNALFCYSLLLHNRTIHSLCFVFRENQKRVKNPFSFSDKGFLLSLERTQTLNTIKGLLSLLFSFVMTIPEKFEVIQENLDVIPENLVVIPEKFDVIPENLVVIPEKLDVMPECDITAMIPESNSTFVVPELDVISEDLVVIPEKLDVIPVDLVVIPEKLDVIPEKLDVIPENLVVIPEKLDVIPEDLVVVPEIFDVMPENLVVIPEKLAVIPENLDVIPECDDTSMILESDTTSVVPDTISLTPEANSANLVPKSGFPKVISISSQPTHGHVRRYSTGNIGVPFKSSVKILSRYLAASKGSCHDTCKYGSRLDFETKTPSSPNSGKRTEKQGKGPEIRKTIPNSAERKTKLSVSFTPSTGSKSQKPDCPTIPKTEVSLQATNENALVKQISLPLQGVASKPKFMISKSSAQQHSCNKDNGDVLYRENKLKSIEEKKVSLSDGKKHSARATTLSALRSVKKVLARQIISLSPKRSRKRVSNIDAERLKSLKGLSPLKDHNNAGEAEFVQPSSKPSSENRIISPAKKDSVSASLWSSYKDKSSKLTKESSPSAHEISRGTLSSDHKKNLKRFKQGISTIRSSISASDNTKHAEADLKNSPRKGGVYSIKDKSSPVRKLSFSKGKVVEMYPAMDSPTRLKYRRRLSDSQIDIIAPRESNLKSIDLHADDDQVSVTKSDCEKVVLKHQDVEEKKSEQHLLNEMIEETATKLAETRKSKVKALVGAFETVISLNDGKPASSADAS
ncbi:uncharacterized protein LOC126673051 isoform X2 [Mercurialis annua]|uniref:uncharacterized protein LOC126673051 isoform X2 n=1 Tax=Mercurialis annua TaxID=3986 RepID=UPI00215E4E52|nr:uncharacterized protein LOC126673051 isoform X2 [Mercurialis annua]